MTSNHKLTVLLLFFLLFIVSCNTQKEELIQNQQTTADTKSQHYFPLIPDKIIFAGQEIILTDEDVKERLDREILTQAFYQSATTQQLKRANRWFPVLEKILNEQGLPDDLKYIAVIESGLTQAVSPVGAEGFWQFMPNTAKEYNLEISKEVDERLDVVKSTVSACKYLKNSYTEFNDWLLAVASYNRGIGGVKQDMKWQQSDHYFDTYQNSETARYVFRLLAIKLIFEHAEEYGFHIQQDALYKPIQTKELLIEKTIPNLSEWSIEKGINFKILIKLNPWLKSNRLTIKTKNYYIRLPDDNENLKPYKKYVN